MRQPDGASLWNLRNRMFRRSLLRPDLDRRVAAAEGCRAAVGEPLQERRLGSLALDGVQEHSTRHEGDPSSRVSDCRRLAMLVVSPTVAKAMLRRLPMSPATTGP